MKTLNGKKKEPINLSEFDDDHIMSSIETPLRDDAFELDEELKVELIEKKFEEIMQVLGLDLNDDSLKNTPKRVAKMFVQEIFKGLSPENKPSVSLFDNKFHYKQMLVEKDINVNSTCEHHFLPIFGKAHVAYISTGKVIGLSKINRIVEYFSKRPQVQERLTIQIANELKAVLETDDVAVVIDAYHMCVSSRGIEDVASSTITAEYSGKFNDAAVRQEFLRYLGK
ncbi:GTP cyclohydrolase I FolE [bacterium]|nr:GTP cyclohydrolase I FolE [bacterium]